MAARLRTGRIPKVARCSASLFRRWRRPRRRIRRQCPRPTKLEQDYGAIKGFSLHLPRTFTTEIRKRCLRGAVAAKSEWNMLHIVDDEEVIRDALCWLAQTRGIAVAAYADGQAFLDALDERA